MKTLREFLSEASHAQLNTMKSFVSYHLTRNVPVETIKKSFVKKFGSEHSKMVDDMHASGKYKGNDKPVRLTPNPKTPDEARALQKNRADVLDSIKK